jgi:hypothetical protein
MGSRALNLPDGGGKFKRRRGRELGPGARDRARSRVVDTAEGHPGGASAWPQRGLRVVAWSFLFQYATVILHRIWAQRVRAAGDARTMAWVELSSELCLLAAGIGMAVGAALYTAAPAPRARQLARAATAGFAAVAATSAAYLVERLLGPTEVAATLAVYSSTAQLVVSAIALGLLLAAAYAFMPTVDAAPSRGLLAALAFLIVWEYGFPLVRYHAMRDATWFVRHTWLWFVISMSLSGALVAALFWFSKRHDDAVARAAPP